MAGSELYRVEIPIIVDDQTDAPLKQAERKISKFEKSAQTETERIRKHFQRIAKYQIEPVMKVRDQLTANVLKADKLIRKLDMAQASPLIAAQDRVSAVVTRINAMLDALDKGKVDVAAEMKGPLLDEIIKAKKSLSELNKVKAGPIAELRGQLFGQLTKAMSQIRGLDLTRAEPQATLRERVTWKVKEISSSLRDLTSRAWNVTLQVKDKVTSTVKNIISKLTSPLALLGAGTGLGASIIFPLKLAGEFEQARMSLDFFMGGVEKGRKAFQDLVKYAAETPFEFSFLQEAMIQLMGAGYNFEQAKRALTAFGDAAGRTGAGMQGVENALIGFTQIASTGALTLQDLRQVALNLRVPLNMFAKELGVAESEIGDIGKKAIPAQKAMEAIVRSLESRFGGGMEQLSNSLLGLVSIIKDTAELTVWHFGKGMAEPVKRILMDIVGLTEETGGSFEQFQQRLERAGEAVGRKFEQIYGRIKEFWASISADPEFQKLDFGDKIIYVINLALDKVSAWLDSEGGMKLQETFIKLGEIGAKAWIAGLKGAFKGAVGSAAHGNLMGAGAMLGLASMLGGGLVLRGAWSLGKSLFGAGKWVLGKLGLGSAGATAAATAGAAAETAAAAGKVGIAGKVLPILGKALSTGGTLAGTAGVLSGVYDIYRGYKETDYEEARKRYWAGGTKIGMVGTGAAIGTAITPGVGTAVGAGIGGIAALFSGTAVGETLRNVWDSFLSWGSEAWDTVATWASNTWSDITTWASDTWEKVKESASNAWNWIKENFTLESIAEKVGYVVGVLESTIFSSEWWLGHWQSVKDWTSEKWDEMKTVWENAKETLSSTLFSSEWWLEKWENVKAWASEKWAGMVEIWENTKEILSSTLFSSEWWLEKWDKVKSWTSEKWNEMKTVWETVKSNISSTLFSKTWWESKWENVKNWASNALSGITARWESIKESFQAGRETGQRVAATKYAIGGILTRPHLGIVAEEGPEAIIPLSARMRARAMDLWLETGRMLGVRPYAEGGLVGTMTEGWREKIPVSLTPSLAVQGPATVNLNFDLTGLVRAVKAGPIAELRGELFGQLSKATSQIRGLDMSRAEPQATLRERVTWKVREIGGSLRNITEKVWTVTMVLHDKASSALNGAVSTLRNVVSKLTSPLMLLGAGAGATAAVAFPLKLAGEFEQARMSLDFYMGGVKEGQRAFEDLVDFAAKTPFEFPFLQSMTVQLMGTGYNFEQAKRAVTAFGDAAGRTGAGMEGISNAMVGFTQIASAGTLNLQDLKQVALNLKLPLNIFAKELGVAESAMGDIGRAGISSQKAMEAIVRTLEKRYAGGLEQLSGSFEGLLSTIKDTARLTVWHFGKGMMEPVKRIMNSIIGLTEDSGKGFEKFQQRLEKLGKNVGESFEDVYKRIKGFWERISSNPAFQKLSFSDKLIFILNTGLDTIDKWIDGEGGQKLATTFSKIGRIIAKTWLKSMSSLGKSAGENLMSGNLLGALVPAAGLWMMGGGSIAKGLFGAGKIVGRTGKWLMNKPTVASTVAKTLPTVATGGLSLTGTVSTLGIGTGIAGASSGVIDIVKGAKANTKEEANKYYWRGGTKLGLVGAGAAIGTAIAPGVGTAIGAGVGGGISLIKGSTIGDTLSNVWADFSKKGKDVWDSVKGWSSETWSKSKDWASNTWDSLETSASNSWEWVQKTFNWKNLSYGAGFVTGYLGETLFSSDWWLGKWDSVKGWTADKWSSFVDVWDKAKEMLSSTIFNSDWWYSKWQSVKDWTSNKWNSFVDIWENIKGQISSTLFSSDWWASKWKSVKDWASNTLAWLEEKGKKLTEPFNQGYTAGKEAGQKTVTATAHAYGGIISQPHLGLIGEAGPEAIIPLSLRMRDRALELWSETGRRLGVRPYAEGNILQGNILGALVPAYALWMLGGGALLKGGIGLGKGIFSIGKALTNTSMGKSMSKVLLPNLTTAGGLSTAGILSTLGIGAGIAGAGAGVIDIIKGIRAEGEEATKQYWRGGTKLGLVGAGAGIGTAIAPGIGTAIGAGIGGIVSLIKGSDIGDALSGIWNIVKIGASDAWNWIQETFNWKNLAYGAGFVAGYLEETLFSADWWLSQWENVKSWTSEKWSSFVDVWNSAMDLLSSTIFSSDWWLSKWQVVKDWTSQKWASFMDIWGSVKEQISSTLFSSDWWISKWQAVKDWASGTLNWLEEKGRKLLSPFEAGVEAGREAGQRAAIAHAYGGIISRPHLGLIAEAGPEAIIPLSSRMRPRALGLWQEAGERLGVRPYAEGGLISLTPAVATSSYSAPINNITNHNYIEVSVSRSNAGPEDIAEAIAIKFETVFKNMPKK